MKSRASRSGGVLLRLLAIVVFLTASVAGIASFSLMVAYQGFATPVILEFPKGTSTSAMATQLADAGVIRYRWQFLVARLLHPAARLQAGEYQFTHSDTTWTIFNRIERGDVFFYELTVPEGSNIFDIAQSLNQFDFIRAADFLRAARDPSLIHDLAPQAPTLEGYLFPSTYRLTRSTTVHQLALMMTDQFRREWTQLPMPDHPVTVNQAVTLASLVEKETAIAGERPLVASVFANRLRLGMALDCDPTTIYAALLDQRYHGGIYRSDLRSPNQYNTYQHAGLPPGPIANPGLASLKAALNPARTDYLYFVANGDGSGTHHFSKTMEEHNRAVASYRHNVHKADPPPVTGAPSRRRPRSRAR